MHAPVTTAPAPITPLSEWDDETPQQEYTTPRHAAGGVAWDLLTHEQGIGADIARIRMLALPEGAASEDMHGFLWDLITEAGEIGYIVAQIDIRGFDLPFDGAKLRTSDMARAVAALMRRQVVETDQPFQPDWPIKNDAVSTD
jgi:hypothetical protein